jgi:hypothetical protein
VSAYILLCASPESPTPEATDYPFHHGNYIQNLTPGLMVQEMSEPGAGFEFHWIHDKNFRFKSGVPTLSDGGSKLWLAGHVYFDYPLPGSTIEQPDPFKPPRRKIGISWIMNNCDPRSTGSSMIGKNLRSVHFRGSPIRLSLPNHCVDYFTWLLLDLQHDWDKMFSYCNLYLDKRVGPFLLNPFCPYVA